MELCDSEQHHLGETILFDEKCYESGGIDSNVHNSNAWLSVHMCACVYYVLLTTNFSNFATAYHCNVRVKW